MNKKKKATIGLALAVASIFGGAATGVIPNTTITTEAVSKKNPYVKVKGNKLQIYLYGDVNYLDYLKVDGKKIKFKEGYIYCTNSKKHYLINETCKLKKGNHLIEVRDAYGYWVKTWVTVK